MARTVEEGDCLLWQGFINSGGTPIVRHNSKWTSVRRLFVLLMTGEAKEGYYGCGCGTHGCVSPKHTEYRTRRQQINHILTQPRTAAARALMTHRRRQSNVKLTMEQARQIRMEEGFNYEIAPKYGVSAEMIRRIRRGEAWQEPSPFAGLTR
jgi:hypothetical protein